MLSDPTRREDLILNLSGSTIEKFSDLRWNIEFKYFSNIEWDKLKRPIKEFQVREEDIRHIHKYTRGLAEEYLEIDPRLFIIYCIGNRGYQVFEIETGNNKK